MDPTLVTYDWLYGFAALIIVIMMLLCLAPMLGSGPRVPTCPPNLKSASSSFGRTDVHVDMVEMVSVPRSKTIAHSDKMKHVSDGTLPGFSKFAAGITSPTFPRPCDTFQKQSSNFRGQNFLAPDAVNSFYVNLATNSYSSLP